VGQTITLTARDGHKLAAYEAKPADEARAGLVIVQEIFGVNAHIRKVADGYAAAGYHAVAPAIYDRAERGVSLGYGDADRQKAISLRQMVDNDFILRDIAAAVAYLKDAGKVGIVGYCLGGSFAWLGATRLDGLSAAIAYYGSLVVKHLSESPRCPVMLHFGENDASIPKPDLNKIQAAISPGKVQMFVYPGAGHAFNREGTPNWREAQAKQALERSLEFLGQHLGQQQQA